MTTRVILPESANPIRLVWEPQARLTDDQFFELCVTNPDVRFERTAEGEIVIVPPCGGESAYQSGEAFAELRAWSVRDGRGRAFDANGMFLLRNGAARSPDAAWVSTDRLSNLTQEQKRKFLPVAPEFIIEVMSPSDRLAAMMAKMEEWIANGVELAWLIQPSKQAVYVYRTGMPLVVETEITSIEAGPPVDGFVLPLERIWQGL